MQTPMKLSLRMAGAALLALATLGLAACGDTKPSAVSGEDMSMGNPAAKVTVIEYASVTCTHCADFNEKVMPALEEKYIKTGKINYIYRPFITAPNDVSAAGALMAQCAGKDKYFKVTDAIMRAQQEMFADGTTANAGPVLLRIAKSVGMTEAQFNTCVTDVKALEQLQKNVEKYTKENNVTGTPTFFINGKKFERKAGDISDFDAAFAELGVK